MSGRSAATQAQRSSSARRRLIAAGITLIGQQGYEATSLASVGEAAGYSRGLVSHHFGSKDSFAQAVFQDLRAQFIREMQTAIREVTGGEALDGYIARYLSVGRARPDVTRCFFILTTVSETSSPELSRLVRTHSAQVRIELERLLGRILRDVRVDDGVDLPGLAIAVDGMLRGVTQELVLDPDLDLAYAISAIQGFVRRAMALPDRFAP